jgi:hypothetical protein
MQLFVSQKRSCTRCTLHFKDEFTLSFCSFLSKNGRTGIHMVWKDLDWNVSQPVSSACRIRSAAFYVGLRTEIFVNPDPFIVRSILSSNLFNVFSIKRPAKIRETSVAVWRYLWGPGKVICIRDTEHIGAHPSKQFFYKVHVGIVFNNSSLLLGIELFPTHLRGTAMAVTLGK